MGGGMERGVNGLLEIFFTLILRGGGGHAWEAHLNLFMENVADEK